MGSHLISLFLPLSPLSPRVAEKRHAEGTFTSDVSSYLKDRAIKEFVDRLKFGQVGRE